MTAALPGNFLNCSKVLKASVRDWWVMSGISVGEDAVEMAMARNSACF